MTTQDWVLIIDFIRLHPQMPKGDCVRALQNAFPNKPSEPITDLRGLIEEKAPTPDEMFGN